MVPDGERRARVALSFLAKPGDPVLGAALCSRTASEVLALVTGADADGEALLAAGPEDTELSRAVQRWRDRLGEIPGTARLASRQQCGLRVVIPGDAEWPTQLDDLGDARPLLLWLRGTANLRLTCVNSVAVVGSRAATGYWPARRHRAGGGPRRAGHRRRIGRRLRYEYPRSAHPVALSGKADSCAAGLRHSERVITPIALPEVVTHYYLAGRKPFLSLSELEVPELETVVADLVKLRDAGRQHRPFGPRYMHLRRLTEARLRELFIAAGGQPERPAPHYFVLGESPWYRGLAENMAQVQLPLSALPSTQTSITYPDSFTAMEFGTQFGIGHQPMPYLGRVFLLNELPGVVEEFGIPDPVWGGDYQQWTTWPTEAYIEVQLWSDEPISGYLPR